jgi:2-amino-4-hydroxy-6-hydroxymethyldihydropteridine diphosphokinase
MSTRKNWNEYAFVALGSNLGPSRKILEHAFQQLQKLSGHPIIRSSIWKTEPIDCPPGSPPFLNAVAGLIPGAERRARDDAPYLGEETPEHLLQILQELEIVAGRKPKTVLNESRPLDLDLITFRGLVSNSERLILPHPRAHLRRFVLAPLAEVAPDLVLPNQVKPVAELLKNLGSGEVVMRLPGR